MNTYENNTEKLIRENLWSNIEDYAREGSEARIRRQLKKNFHPIAQKIEQNIVSNIGINFVFFVPIKMVVNSRTFTPRQLNNAWSNL